MNAPPRSAIAVAPTSRPEMYQAFSEAVGDAGGTVADLSDASALIWADPFVPAEFAATIDAAPHVEWIQLPFAGVEPYVPWMDGSREFTCGKGVYAPPVAEHALGLALAGFRHIAGYARTTGWSAQVGRRLQGSRVTILGAGGITEEFLSLLQPFGCQTTVVRRSPTAMAGADRTITQSELADVLPTTDLLLIAWALTPETVGVVNAEVFGQLPAHAWIVNVGRGGHINTDDLVAAARAGAIGGAALDVTDPEPLPDAHPLWTLPNIIITPHTANTLEMGLPLIAERVKQNVARWIAGDPLIGRYDPDLGY